MSELKNTIKLTGQISPTDTQDEYATHEDIYGKGGYMTVSSLSERDNIPADRRKLGMTVSVATDGTVTKYILKTGLTNTDWALDAGGGSGDVEEAPVDGHTYGRKDGTWKLLNFDSFSPEYIFVNTNKHNYISISYADTPFAAITLDSNDTFHYITINNITEGQSGSLQIKQTAGKEIVMQNMYGDFTMPGRVDDIYVIDYFMRDGELYGIGRSVSVLGDYRIPKTIIDFNVVFYDTVSAQFKWTAPHGDLETDSVDKYEIKYSHTLVDADNAAVWSRMTPVDSFVMKPKEPGTLESFTTVELTPEGVYYFYIKSVQYIKGQTYRSLASNFAYFVTRSNIINNEAPYRIPITVDNLFFHNDGGAKLNGFPVRSSNLLDEVDKLVINTEDKEDGYNKKGYPDLTVEYASWFRCDIYGRDTAYYRIGIDLFQTYKVDKLFIYDRWISEFTVYGCKAIGEPIFQINEYDPKQTFRTKVIDLYNKEVRYVWLQWDRQQFCDMASKPVIPPGEYGFPDPYYNGEIPDVYNLMIYGWSVDGKPDGIKKVKQRHVQKKTMDKWLCTNGHFYQTGYLHRWVSGPNIRLYGHGGHFQEDPYNKYATPDDVKFRVRTIPWVYQNGGWKKADLRDLLEQTYKPFGLKPFLCFTGTGPYIRPRWEDLQYWQDDNANNVTFACQIDQNNGAWYDHVPQPKNESRGIDEYLYYTTDYNNYKTFAKQIFAIAAYYGSVEHEDIIGDVVSDLDSTKEKNSGLDLISGIETENEQDRSWNGFIGYHFPEQCAAINNAAYDGCNNQMIDGNGKKYYGAKNADPNFILYMGGMVGKSPGYILQMLLNGCQHRLDGKFMSDAINTHEYCSHNNMTETSGDVDYAVTLEEYFNRKNIAGEKAYQFSQVRDYLAPEKEFIITEFGYGEGGQPNTASRYQCYSQPGRIIDGWQIPDRHRSDVKGSWTVRGAFQFLEHGVDQLNMYITFAENNWWSQSTGDGGPLGEMYEWEKNEKENPTYAPGTLVEATPITANGSRTGFACFGFFGDPTANGGYPISRSFWFVALFRTILKDHYYVGRLEHPVDEKIMIYSFQHKTENKGVYVVYYNDSINTGLKDVGIPIPDGNSTVNVYKEYIPHTPDPRTLSRNLGYNDIWRTGTPTSRREKYVNGQWVIQNDKYDGKYETFAQGAAVYPANPQEGDEVTVIPTYEENPYFPIVGPTNAAISRTGYAMGANNFEYETTDPITGDSIWSTGQNWDGVLRQARAVSDYIEFHEEGIKGRAGIATEYTVSGGNVIMNVTEFPQYVVFNGEAQSTHISQVTDVKAKAIDAHTMQVWWNNSNVEDTSYEVWQSLDPENSFSKVIEVPFGTNTAVIENLAEHTTYYYKVLAKKGNSEGAMSEVGFGKTTVDVAPIDDLTITNIGKTTITLSWTYTEVLENFQYYSIYRADNDGVFKFLKNVRGISTNSWTDTELLYYTPYSYKIIVVDMEGHSIYSNTVRAVTLPEDTTAPTVLGIATNSVGTEIKVTFDAALNNPPAAVLAAMTLMENAATKPITGVRLDSVDSRILILDIAPYTLANASVGNVVTLAYNAPDTNYLVSTYSIKVESWGASVVTNTIGQGVALLEYQIPELNGDNVVIDRNITVECDIFGTPTHYRMAETADLTNVNWTDYESPNLAFVLSAGAGQKQVYLQLKNTVESSPVYTIPVTYVESVGISSIYVNDTNSTVSQNIKFKFITLGLEPTQYRIAESATALASASWIMYGANLEYTLSSEYGNKVLYAQVRSNDITSNVHQEAINYFQPLANTMVWAMNGNNGFNQKDIINNVGNVNWACPRPSSPQTNVDLVYADGTAFGTLLRGDSNYADTYNRLNFYIDGNGNAGAGWNPPLGNEAGFLPDVYMRPYAFVGDAWNGYHGVVRFSGIAPGTYTVKLYTSTSGTAYEGTTLQNEVYFEINGAVRNITYQTQNNVSNYVQFTGVAISDGTLSIWGKQIDGAKHDKRPGFNVIRIEKTE